MHKQAQCQSAHDKVPHSKSRCFSHTWALPKLSSGTSTEMLAAFVVAMLQHWIPQWRVSRRKSKCKELTWKSLKRVREQHVPRKDIVPSLFCSCLRRCHVDNPAGWFHFFKFSVSMDCSFCKINRGEQILHPRNWYSIWKSGTQNYRIFKVIWIFGKTEYVVQSPCWK